MNSPMIQLIVLAGIALFLILRLKNVLGTRDGFEGPPKVQQRDEPAENARHKFEVIEGEPDYDIIDHVDAGSDAASALADMKRIEPSFSVSEFLQGARGAYEMILMAFEHGRIDEISDFLGPEVRESFDQVIKMREEQNLHIDPEFVGLHQITLADAKFGKDTKIAEITVRYVSELISVVRNGDGEIIEGAPGQSKRQKDTWTFERMMGSDDPNWRLVATSE